MVTVSFQKASGFEKTSFQDVWDFISYYIDNFSDIDIEELENQDKILNSQEYFSYSKTLDSVI